jgi:hypothetical protein
MAARKDRLPSGPASAAQSGADMIGTPAVITGLANGRQGRL